MDEPEEEKDKSLSDAFKNPKLEPKQRHAPNSETRALPGSARFGPSASLAPTGMGQAAHPQQVAQQETTQADTRQESDDQFAVAIKQFEKEQREEWQKAKEVIVEKQAPDRFAIKNEIADIQKRQEANAKNVVANTKYELSGDRQEDEYRMVQLEQRERELNDELKSVMNNLDEHQADQRKSFDETIDHFRKQYEETIRKREEQKESEKQHDTSRVHNGRDDDFDGRGGR